ncbi:MAG TPA: transposase [Fulvivirga sp.]|nr:transposase [Fulvivirga sp.]
MTDYHSKFEFEKYYHIFNRGNNRENIFRDKGNYQYFLSKWERYIDPFADILSYCLMPNHFHFLIRVKSENCLSESLPKPQILGKTDNINLVLEEQFKKLFMSYALAFNKQQSRVGSLFQKRFKRIEVNSDNYLSQIITYIHNNPVHHGFVKDYSDWEYSSYNEILMDSVSLINKEYVLNWFGGRKSFIEYHAAKLFKRGTEFEIE